MKIQVFDDVDAAAREAAKVIAAAARAAHGKFVIAVSGGRTPWQMLRILAGERVLMHVAQVDERIAPAGDPDRNLTHLRQILSAQVYSMPVEESNLDEAAKHYAKTLEQIAGTPPVLDLVHLGLGADGHTASLVPGDLALDVTDRDVAVTGVYQNRRRMTLTYPVLNRARRILWLVTGAEKAAMLSRLIAGDPSIPAGRVRQERALVIADRAAAGGL
jgi:6-phosphogluconolactonase